MAPFADYTNFADCVRQNPQADDPNAYCASIQARTENKAVVRKAVTAASITYQAVRNALLSVVAKRDPVKEVGDKKLKEDDGVAADGAQDDQAFAVAWGPDNYDKLTKDIMVMPYKEAYQAAGAVVKAIEHKAMNFPGDLEDHLKKAHAAIHGREMWDARYGNVCKLLKQARKLLHDIEKTAEVAAQGGDMPQVVGKADPIDKQMPTPTVGTQPFKTPRTPGQKLRTAAAQESTQSTHFSGGKYRDASGKPLPYQKAARQHGKDIYGKRPGVTGPGPAHIHPHKTGPTASRKASYAYKAVRKAVAAAGR